MFVVFLKFADNRDQAGEHLDAHKAWIKKGVDDGVFLIAGSLQPQLGGAVIAHNTSADGLTARVNEDPFVIEGVVSAEVMEITPAIADERMKFLVDAKD
jgi:uncharacterized protein YciI